MPALCLQTQHQSPLSGPHGPCDHDCGNAARKEGRVPRPCQTQTPSPPPSSSNHFSGEHSVTGQQTLRTAGVHLIPTRNKGLLHYLPHRNLDVCNGSRLSHRAHGLLRASLRQNERAHREKQRWGVCFYIKNLIDERNLHSIKSFCSPDL